MAGRPSTTSTSWPPCPPTPPRTPSHRARFSALSSSLPRPRKPRCGPLLVLTGGEDRYVSYELTAATFRDTCEIFPEGNLEFAIAIGTGHVPSLDATQQLWLGWIEDRLAGRPLPSNGCMKTDLENLLPVEQSLKSGNAFPQWEGSPEYSYETPLGV